MLGAIIGDVVGSRFEFNNTKNYDFELFNDECTYTDDTVCTVAFMDWLNNAKVKDDKTATDYLHRWCRKYPNAGYGGRFASWVMSDDPKPYGSYGNGAGMRISPIGYKAKSINEVESLTITATQITHNHVDGLLGAIVIAKCIYMAKTGAKKDEIKEYIAKYYPEIRDYNYDDLKQTFEFDETCKGTVPQAVFCFLISDSFEDCIRKTVSLGGDCDTTAAMSGAIAEAYYGLPEDMVSKVMDYLDDDMKNVIEKFYKKI